jgi:hypothetical protein
VRPKAVRRRWPGVAFSTKKLRVVFDTTGREPPRLHQQQPKLVQVTADLVSRQHDHHLGQDAEHLPRHFWRLSAVKHPHN